MLFEPTKAAGLGIRPSSALLQAGVVAVEHLSARAKVCMDVEVLGCEGATSFAAGHEGG